MLTAGGNQYLRPEYLTPLPTTLDAKKSPLALLAQTCSQIGADSPPSKPLLPPLEKASKGKAETPREKASPASSSGSEKPSAPAAFKPYEASAARERSAPSPEERAAASRSRTPARGSSTPGRCASTASASPRASPAAGPRTPASATGTPLPPATSAAAVADQPPAPPPAPAAPAPAKERPASPKAPFGALFSDPALKDLPLGTYKPGYLGYPSHFPADLGLLAPHHLKASSALSPYSTYARMKAAAGADSLMPVCRDPYCTGCQFNSHLLASSGAVAAAVAVAAGKSGAAACPGGCAQCEHAGKAAAAAAAAAGGGASGFLPAGGHAAAFAHAQLAALAAASHLPYVCSWIASDASYCGKRFASSEELLQHLRSHTALGAAAAAADALLGAGAGTGGGAGAGAGAGAAHAPLLPRAYPTPPLSPLASARFHPYAKPPLLPPSLGFPLHAHPALPPYFSPYALYGQRLGAAAAAAAASSMHP